MQFNEAENYLKDSLYEAYLSTFLHRDISKKLGMSFDDFINRPKYEIDSMLKLIDEIDKKKNALNENMLKSLENTKNHKHNDME